MTVAATTRTLPKMLAFDVFGTVVDWRSGVARDSAEALARIGRADVDPAHFADIWRMQYLSTMRDYAASGRAFVTLDVLHREMLDAALRGIGVDPSGLDADLLVDWTRAWHRLDPWPDVVGGLVRLKARFPLVTLSNGGIAMMLAMARRGGLPWDAILGADVSGHYKPGPRAYLDTARLLDIAPGELCLIAAHHSDLAAARACGLMTAYVDRPHEYGGRAAPDAAARQDWDWTCGDFGELADRLGG